MKRHIHLFIIVFSLLSISNYAQNALSFDGTDDMVSTTALAITGSTTRTIEAWINTTANADPSNGGSQKVIVDMGSFVTGGRFTFNMLWGNTIRVEVGGSGLNGTTAVNNGQWHHVAVVYDPNATNKFSLYVDGALDNSGNIATPVNTLTGNIIIGRRIDNINYWNGTIDEVRIWNTARTATEISANKDSELCTHPNLVAYYKFNQGTAGGTNTGLNTLTDNSGNSYDGTLTGFALSGTSSNWVIGKILTASGSSTTSTINPTSCGSYTSPSGQVYTSSGTYTDVISNSQGCDSIITINLTVLNNSTNTISPSSCGSYISPSGNYIWSSNGTYTDTLVNAVGCDSIVTVQLTIIQIYTSVLQSNNFLTANQTGATYQWLDCDNGYAIIPGATNQSFTATVNGNYAVEIDINGCLDTSACYNVTGMGIDENDPSTMKIYPNPGSNFLTIDFQQNESNVIVEIRSLVGKTVYSDKYSSVKSKTIYIDLPKGIYFINIKTEKSEITQKWIRS